MLDRWLTPPAKVRQAVGLEGAMGEGRGDYFLLRGGRRNCGDGVPGLELGLGLRLGLGSCLPQGAM